MENRIKKNRIIATIGTALFISAFLFNVTLFVKSNDSNDNSSLSSLFSQASAEDEGGGGESGGGGSYRWSSPIACSDNPDWGYYYGSYRVCNSNGSGNSCGTAGDVTCQCNPGNSSNTCSPSN